MPGFKVDDRFWSHPKVLELSPHAVALWVRAGSYCAAYRTGGKVTPATIRVLGSTPEIAAELVACGLWEAVDGIWWFSDSSLFSIVTGDYRPKIPRSVRQRVFDRDGGQCVNCWTAEDLSIDHIVPWSKGGAHDISNFQTLCKRCNSIKGARV